MAVATKIGQLMPLPAVHAYLRFAAPAKLDRLIPFAALYLSIHLGSEMAPGLQQLV